MSRWWLDHWTDMRLRYKLLLINLLAMFLAALVGAAAISWWAWEGIRDQAEVDAMTRARVVADNAAAGLLFHDPKAVTETLGALQIDKRVLYVAVFDEQGKSFVQRGNAMSVGMSAEPLQSERVILAGDFLEVWMPIRIEQQPIGMLLVREDVHTLRQRVISLVGTVLMGMLLAAMLGGLIIYYLLPRLLAPLSKLSGLMQHLSRRGDYSHRAEICAHDEVGELAESFNQMIQQIEDNNRALSEELRQRREMEIKLDRLAHYDNVTQLTNRHYFEHRLRGLLQDIEERQAGIALLFLDLDNFKRVNDTYGHHVGDVLLRSVADRMRSVIRIEDEISRLGGDEFAVLLTEVGGRDEIGRVAQKFLEVLSHPVRIEGHDILVGISIGSVLLPEDTTEFGNALRFADVAMYDAKHRGKNNHQEFRQALLADQGQRLKLEGELRQALDEAELEVYYQPIYILGETHTLVGAEALVRWRHPERGLLLPDEFIPLAEENGLIVPLGEWVLRTACHEAMVWRAEFGHPLFVSVNLSPRQLSDVHVLARIRVALKESGLDPALLDLELTESILTNQSSESILILRQIAEMGVQLVLDDFGTGYSSLAYLKHFPIAKLKIDRSFVTELPDNLDDKSICDAVIGLGRSLAVVVLAEGVETQEQVDMLSGMGCQQAQGDFFSHPVPADEFRQLVLLPTLR
ncbi:EAL domain-containing protein [Ferriphaselus sp. R-1]|uniref:putative bifunctional diguanylate cyclase/phosphodiesterase n=1 Tax=Ferriphaselus sp. R-1 TaxID=1485544 RepID=UPI000691808D|nr:EAL domain-containing protein [Ferriphaselus sp. R-1]